jgi:hypothetical protein
MHSFRFLSPQAVLAGRTVARSLRHAEDTPPAYRRTPGQLRPSAGQSHRVPRKHLPPPRQAVHGGRACGVPSTTGGCARTVSGGAGRSGQFANVSWVRAGRGKHFKKRGFTERICAIQIALSGFSSSAQSPRSGARPRFEEALRAPLRSSLGGSRSCPALNLRMRAAERVSGA